MLRRRRGTENVRGKLEESKEGDRGKEERKGRGPSTWNSLLRLPSIVLFDRGIALLFRRLTRDLGGGNHDGGRDDPT